MNELRCPNCNSDDLIIEQPHWGSEDDVIDIDAYCISCDINFTTTAKVTYRKPKKSDIQDETGYPWSA